METSDQWQNYWLWLKERGQVIPQFSAQHSTFLHNFSTLDQEEADHSTAANNLNPGELPNSIDVVALPNNILSRLSGFGADNPRILFVGDAPMQLDESNMMIKMIQAIHLDPFQDTFVSDFFGGITGWPTNNQMVSAQIDLITYLEATPSITCVASLGVGGAKILYGPEKNIKSLKSQWFKTKTAIPLDCIATFHPRDMIRRPESRRPAWEDLLNIKSKLESKKES